MFKLKKLGLFRKTPNRYYVQKAKESDTKITVDESLNINSENPVMNKTITHVIDRIQQDMPSKQYLHKITHFSSANYTYLVYYFLSTDNTPLTIEKIAKFLYDNGYNATNKLFSVPFFGHFENVSQAARRSVFDGIFSEDGIQ